MSEALYPEPYPTIDQPEANPASVEQDSSPSLESALALAMSLVESEQLVQNRRPIKHHETSEF